MRLHRIIKLFFKKPMALWTIYRIRRKGLSFLSLQALLDLGLAMVEIQERKVPGIVVEVGVGLGGSAILLTSIKERERPLYLYDTFEMIPPPSKMDGEDAHERYRVIQSGQAQGLVPGEKYYGYIENLIERVKVSLENFGFPTKTNNVVLIKGLVEETMRIDHPVALAHIDCDWYSPVKYSLEHIIPRSSIGGRVIIDDYYHWSGARKAVDDFFVDYDMNNYQVQHLSRLHIVKNSS